MRGAKASILAISSLLAILGLALLTGTASAETTHKYVESWSTGGYSQVGGVDAEGNVYLYYQGLNVIKKFDAEGNPVNFSALGSNTIDGAGGFNCPTVPGDCDRVPRGGLFGIGAFANGGAMAVDPRASGPGAGYIYVASTNTGSEPQPGQLEVFNPAGEYVGELDRTITFPNKCVGLCVMGDISVDSNGHVYQAYCCAAEIDQWVPVDANPAHDKFIGQLRASGLSGWTYGVGGSPFSYGLGEPPWQKFTSTSFLAPRGDSVPIDMSPDPGPFGDGGEYPNGSGSFFQSLSIDPYTQNVYLHGLGSTIEEWDQNNNMIGPDFGEEGAGYVTGIGFAPDGRLFMAGSADGGQSVAVFSAAVPIPDISYEAPTIDHEGFTVHGHVSLAGGPEVTSCKVEYGSGIDGNGNPTYGTTVPCDPAAPFSGEEAIEVPISGLQTETDYHYRIVAGNENGTMPGADQVAHTAAVLELKTKPATEVDRTTATLNGSLNPDGLPTTYRFEYGLDTEYDTSTAEQSAGSGSGSIDVTPVHLTQLQSGRTYHYRIVAVNSLGTSYGEDGVFQAARTPAISGVRATEVTETSATLNALVNPSSYDTEYFFEYGTSPEYGTKTPAAPEDIGSGTEGVKVEAKLTNLQPRVVYHFRVVAINKWGTTLGDDTTFSFFPPACPNEHVRQQTQANYLPDCRAYELVSPGDAGAIQFFPSSVTGELGTGFGLQTEPGFSVTPQNTGMAEGPSRFSFFGGLGAMNGVDVPNSLIDMYLATRTDTGWVTTFPGLSGAEALTIARPQCDIAMSECIVRRAPSITGAGEPLENAPYVFDVSGKSLGRWPTNLGAIEGGAHFNGDGKASPDFSHFVFSSSNVAFAPGGLTSAPGSVYDNDVAARTVTIASKLPGGGDIARDPSAPADETIQIPAVSTDGSHILMSARATDGPTRLYMRVDGAVTYEVSRGTGVSFIGMTNDGSKVFFSSSNQLTPDDHDTSTDIYEWSEAGDELTRLSQGNGEGDSDSCNASYVAQCNATPLDPNRGRTQFGEPGIDDYLSSQSGEVYFYSPEQLDPSNPGVANQRNLYVYRDGKPQYVATFDPGTKVNRSQIAPDGSHAAFLTAAQLTGYDNDGFEEMYTYDASTGVIQCASCNPSGAPPTGNVIGSAGGPFMANDGRTFFTTPDALVPQDTNGLMDVYEFVDGRPQLISAGTGERDLYAGGAFFPPQPTGLEAVSANGVDVFFSTFDTLVPEDLNGQFIKFYDARTGGGFTYNAPLAACSAADECHEAGSEPPAEVTPGSTAVLTNPGNVASPHKAKKKSKGGKKSKAHRRNRAHRKSKKLKRKHRRARRHGGNQRSRSHG